MRNNFIKTLILCALLVSLCSCSNEEEYVAINKRLSFAVPSNFPQPAQDIEYNYPTEKGFELGRKLFYDGRLSADGTISCSF